MSFFGFDPTRHNDKAPGFSQAHDPFAGLSTNGQPEDALDFEDTYDGLGDQLDETGDAFNDETFGGDGGGEGAPAAGSAKVGKDFDFFGQTANVAEAFEQEHLLYNRNKPVAPKQAQPLATNPYPSYYIPEQVHKPARTGYEKYKDPEPVPDLHVDHSIWGTAPTKSASQPANQPQTSRKVLSLEEVEAGMQSVSMPASDQYASLQQKGGVSPPESDFLYAKPAQPQPHPGNQTQLPMKQDFPSASNSHVQMHPTQILQRPQSLSSAQPNAPVRMAPSGPSQAHAQPTPAVHPIQILQNPNRSSAEALRMVGHLSRGSPGHRSQGSNPQVPLMPNPALSEEERAALLDLETKRAKRNHKIWLLSRDNGLMTPQDKNFITRIQLQQLVSATGATADHDDEGALNDDFYYQVHASIRGGHRQNPSQPLHNFAQTYLYQTGSRQGGSRRHGRVAENHVQRMEQQVQRAVEAAKNKPKNPQLVIAGTLGKISFSNAKTPKPLLSIKRGDNGHEVPRPSSRKAAGATGMDRKAILRSIEKVYATLMKMEDNARHRPPPTPGNGIGEEELRMRQMEWLEKTNSLNAQLWDDLKVHEPIGATALHPFIGFLSFNKGKKAIPRVFRHITFEQRTTILTMIVYHLDQLDVVKGAQVDSGEIALNAAMRENIELFSIAVMPSLFAFLNETGLDIVDGVLELISKQLNVDIIAKSRIGTSMLTMILSRAELLKQAGGAASPQQWVKWEQTFGEFFDILEPHLPNIFPESISSGDDIYVWQLLAAIGVSSTPQQQQRLVLAVKDRVHSTISHAKTLPQMMSAQRLSNVNLFMQSIGLDVELLS